MIFILNISLPRLKIECFTVCCIASLLNRASTYGVTESGNCDFANPVVYSITIFIIADLFIFNAYKNIRGKTTISNAGISKLRKPLGAPGGVRTTPGPPAGLG
jgi:hypothetical protein